MIPPIKGPLLATLCELAPDPTIVKKLNTVAISSPAYVIASHHHNPVGVRSICLYSFTSEKGIVGLIIWYPAIIKTKTIKNGVIVSDIQMCA